MRTRREQWHRTRAQSGLQCTKHVYRTETEAHDALTEIKKLARAGAAHRRERYVQACWDHGDLVYHLTSHKIKRGQR